MVTLVGDVGPEDRRFIVAGDLTEVRAHSRFRIDDELVDLYTFDRHPLTAGYRHAGTNQSYWMVARGVGDSQPAAHTAGTPLYAAVQAFVSGADVSIPPPFPDASGVGSNGEDGEDGQNGTPGASAYQVAVANGFQGNEAAWLASLVGEKGDPGDVGPQGEQGIPGSPGAQGDPGPPGQDGAVGEQGPAGDVGPAGAEGPQGDPGQAGSAGPQGDIGPQGPKGDKGDTGDTGPQGEPGTGGGEAFPVGSVFLSVVSTDPATLLGYGTWAAIAGGRLLAGFDSGQGGFDADEETGGADTHQHAAHSSPLNHTHTVSVTDPGHVHTMQRFPTATGGSTGFTVDTSMSGTPAAANDTASKVTGVTASTANPAGGVASQTHDAVSHLPPYITVHVWKRTA